MIGDKYNTEALDAHLKVCVVEEHSIRIEGGWRLNLDFIEESMQT